MPSNLRNMLIAVAVGYFLRWISTWFTVRNIKKSNKKMRELLVELLAMPKLLNKAQKKKVMELINEND